MCNGDKADFNTEAAYGGNIDPRTAQLPDSRVLRANFIETILTNDKYRGAITRHGVRVSGARFAERIDLQNAELRHELWFEGCLFEKGADLSWLQSTQPIAFDASKVTGDLSFYAAQIASDLRMTNSRVAEVILRGAHVSRTLDLSHLSAAGALNMSGIEVGSDLTMISGQFAEVELLGARVGHTLDLSRSKITGKLHMDSLQVGVYLHIRDATLAEVNLLGAHVQNQLTLDRSTVTGALGMFEIQIGTDLWMPHAAFSGAVNLRNAQIGGQIDWSGTTFQQNVNLTGARVGGALNFDAAKWSKNVTLIARYAKFGVIPGLTSAWPDKLELDGLTYADIGPVGDNFEKWFGKLERYARQPYEQLANVLQAKGDIPRATAVRYAARDRDRRELSGPIFAWLTLLDWVIGYGYYPYRSIVWVFLLVILGAVVLRVSGQGPKNAMPIGLSYSFDMLLPVIRLREMHYAVDLTGAPRYYFYCHKIMGWVLASFLVAGLSGLTK